MCFIRNESLSTELSTWDTYAMLSPATVKTFAKRVQKENNSLEEDVMDLCTLKFIYITYHRSVKSGPVVILFYFYCPSRCCLRHLLLWKWNPVKWGLANLFFCLFCFILFFSLKVNGASKGLKSSARFKNIQKFPTNSFYLFFFVKKLLYHEK